MTGLWKIRKALNAWGIPGINRRDLDYELTYNKRRLSKLADDKILTKERATQAGLEAPQTYGVIAIEREIRKLGQIVDGHSDFVIKPARGTGGKGILVITERFEDRYRTLSGQIVTHADIEDHVSDILSGAYSRGDKDRALVEYRVIPDDVFQGFSGDGVPDIRVTVLMGYPVMAMLRIPTRQSAGWTSRQPDAIGVGIDIASGMTLRGTWLKDIGKPLDKNDVIEGFRLPAWNDFMKLAARCHELCGLGYIEVDMMLDQNLGPLVIEINARPDLGAQIANECGLACRAEGVEARIRELARGGAADTPEQRVLFAQKFLGQISGSVQR
ncbi:alpha-L-glutamate ligase-like protein [Pseudomonas viridiflava]|uniref:alpha-L-glutamate ligase-like protein n=1 Tax=Pseudomonas viridiflava TaxID=33069 RepID=UPI0003FBAA84|nr:alpha-L-glutamate ligase-like protein [Pseudomonas viridiflava]